jgi:hypothetical protein
LNFQGSRSRLCGNAALYGGSVAVFVQAPRVETQDFASLPLTVAQKTATAAFGTAPPIAAAEYLEFLPLHNIRPYHCVLLSDYPITVSAYDQ